MARTKRQQSVRTRTGDADGKRQTEASDAVKALGGHTDALDGRVLGLLELLDSGLLLTDELVFILREWSLEEAVSKVVAKECNDIVDVWERDPAFVRKRWPGAIVGGAVTLQGAIRFHGPGVLRRYADGKCSLCGGSAYACAPRHARGRSCD